MAKSKNIKRHLSYGLLSGCIFLILYCHENVRRRRTKTLSLIIISRKRQSVGHKSSVRRIEWNRNKVMCSETAKQMEQSMTGLQELYGVSKRCIPSSKSQIWKIATMCEAKALFHRNQVYLARASCSVSFLLKTVVNIAKDTQIKLKSWYMKTSEFNEYPI